MLCAKFGWNWPSGSGDEDFKYLEYKITISILSPLGERRGPSFEQTWIPSTQGCFVTCLVEIGPVDLEKKSKIGKVHRQRNRQTDTQTDKQTMDDRRSEKLTRAFSSGKLKKVGPFIYTNLNPLHPRMFCAKLSWKWHIGSLNCDHVICYLIITL